MFIRDRRCPCSASDSALRKGKGKLKKGEGKGKGSTANEQRLMVESQLQVHFCCDLGKRERKNSEKKTQMKE
jgi:hypothetical protein